MLSVSDDLLPLFLGHIRQRSLIAEEILQVLDEAWRDVALVATKYYFE